MAFALTAYQLLLIAVGYGKLRPSFFAARPASGAHRASGDAMFEDDAVLHIAAGSALLTVLALKIVLLRRWHARAGSCRCMGRRCSSCSR